MLNWLINLLRDLYDNTFGEMTGPQILWTVIALVTLYQLVAIKWRLIDRNRHNGIPHSFLAGLSRRIRVNTRTGALQHMQSGTTYNIPEFDNSMPVARTNLDGVGFNAHLQGRLDLKRYSDVELAKHLTPEDFDRLNKLAQNMNMGLNPDLFRGFKDYQ